MSENKKILEFYSDICRPCKLMSPIAQKVADKLNINLEKYEISKSPDEAKKHGVKSVPTFIILKNGVEWDRLTGAVSEKRLEEFFGS